MEGIKGTKRNKGNKGMKCKKTPYPSSEEHLRKSPFKNMATTLKALKHFKKGKSIGFTRRASLKSMGLLPRSNGCYVLGNKYT
jgi:hypothetical protein